MRLHRTFLAIIAIGSLAACAACLDLVLSVHPWFEVDESGSTDLLFDARLLGLWCVDDEGCPEEETLRWTPGPGDSYNVFEEDQLAYRVWLGEIDGTRFLDFRFLCEPSLGTGDDHCGGPVGHHLVARVQRLEHEVVEFQILEEARFKEFLDAEEEPMAHGTPYGEVVLVEETETLRDFLGRSGRDDDLWSEPIRMTRAH